MRLQEILTSKDLDPQIIEAARDTAVQRGERAQALLIQARLLKDTVTTIELPAEVNVWKASEVSPMSDDSMELQRLNANHIHFGGSQEGMLYDDCRRHEIMLARTVVAQMGCYSVTDNSAQGQASWRTLDGDLHAVLLDTQSPYTERTAHVLQALDEAGYTRMQEGYMPTPFSNNLEQNNIAWQSQR